MGEFRATKVIDKKEAKLGDVLTYTITAENIVKDSILTNVVISDDLPAGLSLVKDSVEVEIDGKHVEFDKEKIETIGNKAKVTFKELKGGQKISISLKAKVTDKAAENIVNIALVEGENPEKPGEPVEPAKPKEEVPVKPTEPSTTEPEEKEETPKTPGKPSGKNPKEPQNPQGKPATKNSQFLPKTSEYMNSNASIIQGLTLILGTMYLIVMRRKMKSDEL